MGVLPVEERGMGEPVVLLHAGVADRTMWREHLERLDEAGLRGVAIDLPGFGDAAPSSARDAPLEDVLQTLKALDIRSTHIVGNSYGAAVALRVLVLAPAIVRSAVLISPPPLNADPSPALRAAWDAEEEALGRGDLDAAVEAVLDAWLQPHAPAALRARIGGMQRRAFECQRGAPAAEAAPDPLEPHPELLSQLRMPVLALAGEADMPDFQAGAEEIAAAVPSGRMEVLSGAGHLAPLETPDTFWNRLIAHLRDTTHQLT